MIDILRINNQNPGNLPTMERALVKAGAPKRPGNYKIWAWLKDHPNTNGSSIAKAIVLPLNNVSSLLSDMVERGMVAGKKEYSAHLKRQITFYKTVGVDFELRPYLPEFAPKHVAHNLIKHAARKSVSQAAKQAARQATNVGQAGQPGNVALQAVERAKQAPAALPATALANPAPFAGLESQLALITAEIEKARAVFLQLQKIFGEK